MNFSSEVARHIRSDSYALIFGVNTFISLILQTCLTYTVAADGGLKLNIRQQVGYLFIYFIWCIYLNHGCVINTFIQYI